MFSFRPLWKPGVSASTRKRDTPWAARFSDPVWNSQWKTKMLRSEIQKKKILGHSWIIVRTARLRAYLGDHNTGVGQPAVGDVNLAPVDDPVIPVLLGVSPDTWGGKTQVVSW